MVKKKYCLSYYSKSAILNRKLSKLAASVFLYRKFGEHDAAGLSSFWSKKVLYILIRQGNYFLSVIGIEGKFM